MKVQTFDYDLPKELIAQAPAAERDRSRLMVLNRSTGEWIHSHFHDLPEFLKAGDTLVLNDTKVIPARLVGKRPTGGKITLLLVRELAPLRWTTLLDTPRRLQPGEEIRFDPEGSCRIVERTETGPWVVDFNVDPRVLMHAIGQPPLPPYIRRKEGIHPDDMARYQTVYADQEGSIAAPTAGLHFTPELLKTVEHHGVTIVRITLHIGLGTFKPIQTEEVEEHRMEEEVYTISPEAEDRIRDTRKRGGRIIAVGTTACRTLESSEELTRLSGPTRLFIHPPYPFRLVDAMITNFHLPRGTPLMLVCALAGKELILRAYQEAIRERYRFYSYGDAMLIL